jgi:hypothetical protein
MKTFSLAFFSDSAGACLCRQLSICFLSSRTGFEINSELHSLQRIDSDNTRDMGMRTAIFFFDPKIELLHNRLKQ